MREIESSPKDRVLSPIVSDKASALRRSPVGAELPCVSAALAGLSVNNVQEGIHSSFLGSLWALNSQGVDVLGKTEE